MIVYCRTHLSSWRLNSKVLPFFTINTYSKATPFRVKFLCKLPSISYMGWSVEFWNNFNSPDPGIFYQLTDIFGSVDLSRGVCTPFRKFWNTWENLEEEKTKIAFSQFLWLDGCLLKTYYWKTWCVSDVPVKDIEFGITQPINDSFQLFFADEISSCVNQKTLKTDSAYNLPIDTM